MNTDFDLITIGAGSGGVAASRRAAALGAKVALIEAGRVGGTCVLRGCVPKKLLMYAAQYADGFHEATGYGWSLPVPPIFDMSHWSQAKAAETARLEGIYRNMLNNSGVTVLAGHGALIAPHQVRVGTDTFTAKHVLIATGAAPARDTIAGIESCATSDELLDLDSIPSTCAVIGGGYIAVEFAGMLARLGARTSLYFRDVLPLRGFDAMVRKSVVDDLQSAGVGVHAQRAPIRIERQASGFSLIFADGSTEHVAWVLNATGRRPNTQGLGLDLAGIRTIKNTGAIEIDHQLRTSLPHHYAIGDVTNRMNLTPVAIAEGRALVEHLFGGASAVDVDLSRVATAVFTLPPAASVGPTEADALAQGFNLDIYEADFRPMRQAFINGKERTRMKLLVDQATQKVLAIHMVGADAAEIVQSLAVAITAGATKRDFDRTVAVHPTAAEEFVLMRQVTRTARSTASA